MADRPLLLEMETMFMAFADRTRLRLLNLMADDEVCVNFFTEVLGESQPKVSRHLAYLRNADLVETRRHGKWIYYSIKWPESQALVSVLNATLSALPDDPELQSDKVRLSNMSSGHLRLPAEDEVNPRAIYDPPTPSRPVHNELDEFLL
jgi:ArsR family transcriptional regulator, arsenate/arsenite/antimonite-responsive transcriptional repressor